MVFGVDEQGRARERAPKFRRERERAVGETAAAASQERAADRRDGGHSFEPDADRAAARNGIQLNSSTGPQHADGAGSDASTTIHNACASREHGITIAVHVNGAPSLSFTTAGDVAANSRRTDDREGRKEVSGNRCSSTRPVAIDGSASDGAGGGCDHEA